MKIVDSNITSLNNRMSYNNIDNKDKENNLIDLMINKKDDEEDEGSTVNERLVKKMKRNTRLEKIAAKVAQGREISGEDRNYLSKHNPGLLQKAYTMNRERKSLEEKIRMCKTKEEADRIIFTAREKGITLALSNLNSEGGNVGKIALETVDKADENTITSRRKKEETEKKARALARKKINSLV